MEYIFEKSGRRRKAERVICATCNSSFLKRSSFVEEVNYCSRECFSETRKTQEQAKCSLCDKQISPILSRIKASKSGLLFCSRSCKDKGQRISSNIPEIQPGHYCNNRRNYRKVAFRDSEKKCEICGYDKHEAALIVHHKDRNRENNTLDNLQVLCSNCHLIEHFEAGDGLFNRRISGS